MKLPYVNFIMQKILLYNYVITYFGKYPFIFVIFYTYPFTHVNKTLYGMGNVRLVNN